jgi:hypothetical protein
MLRRLFLILLPRRRVDHSSADRPSVWSSVLNKPRSTLCAAATAARCTEVCNPPIVLSVAHSIL